MNENDFRKIKLGEGAYGCVIKGTLGYSVNKDNNTVLVNSNGEVTKIMINKHDFDVEIKNTLIANSIDRDTSLVIHAISILDHNDVKNIFNDPRNITMFNKLNVCKNIIDKILRIKNIYQIIYSDEGILLPNIDQFISNFDVKILISLFYELFNGLFLFRKNRFNHFDIKENNIVYIPKSKKLVFIDFGMSCYDSEINTDSMIEYVSGSYDNLRFYYSPEIIAYSVIKTRKGNLSNIDCYNDFKARYEQVIKKNNDYSKKQFLINALYKNDEKLYENELKTIFIGIYTNIENNRIGNEWFREQIQNLDAYKLSWTLLDLLHHFDFFENRKKKVTVNFCNSVLLKSIQIHPDKRTKINDIISDFNLFLNING